MLAYAVEGACKGTARIARVEECDNPLPKDTNIPNLGMENVENERCTKARLLPQANTLHTEPQGCVAIFSAWSRAREADAFYKHSEEFTLPTTDQGLGKCELLKR